MGSIQTNVVNTQQSFTNNILQRSENDCWANNTSDTSGNIVIVDGSVIGGNFTGVQSTLNTDASCVITSTMETTVDDILKSIVQQTTQSSNSLFGGFTFSGATNVYNASQTVVNNITQINQATCAANSTKVANGNYVYIRNSSVFGDYIGVSSSSESSASCTMNNTMKNSVYNDAQASSNQQNQIQSMFVAMVAAIASVIGGIVLLGFLLLGGGTVAVAEFSGGGGGSYTDDDQAFQDRLDEQYRELDDYRSRPIDDYRGSRDDYSSSDRSSSQRSSGNSSPPPVPNNSPSSPGEDTSTNQPVSVQS